MTVKERLRALGDVHPRVGEALDVQDRFGEINGSFTSSAIAISVFLAIFPLLLVAIAVVGFVASGDEDLGARVADNLGLTGSAADLLTNAVSTAADSKRAASIVGFVGLVWSASGVGTALQGGVRTPWQEQASGIRDRLTAMAWMLLVGIGFEVLKLGGTLFVPRLVANSSALYGPIGVVFAVIAWLTLLARLIVYASALNAVRYERREGTCLLYTSRCV